VAPGCRSTENTANEGMNPMTKESQNQKVATFAGGCFWCTESDFKKVPGVLKVVSGYTGGKKENPTYEEVCSGRTGHLEAVQIYYDPAEITYGQLLDIFWRHIDPTDEGGQFVDRGSQYRSAVFYHDEEQKGLAEKSRDALAKSAKFARPVATEILPLHDVLRGRGLPPGLLPEEPPAIPVLPVQFGPRLVPEKDLGR